jgi:hypothetical protein
LPKRRAAVVHHRPSTCVLDERNGILRRPWPEIAAPITDTGKYAARLREPTPFADILTPDERERAYAAFRT